MLKNSGFTILEISIVLIVAGFLSLASLQLLSTFFDRLEAQRVNNSAHHILNAMSAYYEHHCSRSGPIIFSISNLKNENFLSQDMPAINPYGTDFSISIEKRKTQTVFSVKTVFHSENKSSFVSSLDDSSILSGKTVIWKLFSPINRTAVNIRSQNNNFLFGSPTC